MSDYKDLIERATRAAKRGACSCPELLSDMSDALERMEAERGELLAIAEAWLNVAANCSIESGCCCCGESMQNHSSSWEGGHTPVDMADTVVPSLIGKTDAAIARVKGK